MDFKELTSFRVSDAIKFHDELNPKLWIGNKLRPEVKKQLKLIAEDFIEELGISGLDVKDITVSGSNAAYTYTPHSDLDLHILVDMDDLPHDEVYRELFTAKKTIYNDSHNITVHNVPVELYVQDVNEPVVSVGEYSILNDRWLKIPTKRRANFDQNATAAKYDKLLKVIQHALKSKKLSTVNKVIQKIKQYRKAGLDKGGEFGPENLAYKALRNQDYITRLYDLRDKLHSEELTIETMYMPVGDSKLSNRPALTVRSLAKKHNVSIQHILNQLKKGIEVEKKHTTYLQTAREIALDHLADDPKYYIKSKQEQLEEEQDNELPKKVYHVTPSENLDSILSKGLLPTVGDRSSKITDEKSAIYCFPDKNSMEDAVVNWLGDEFDEDVDLALLEIDTQGLDGEVTKGAEYEIAITEKIPPNKIKVLSKNLAMPMNESRKRVADEDYHPNAKPPGPESKPTMPKGTVKVDVSDVYDWYKLGQHISNLKGLGKHDFGAGPPSTILSFGDEDLEHQYIKALQKTGLTTTDIDPIDPNQPKGMKRQKVDPTYKVDESFMDEMSTKDMIAYLRQHHDKNLHPDYLNHLTNTNSKFVLKNISINSIRTELAGLDRAKVEQYKQMDFSKAPPIVVGSDGNILDGYHRATVAKALGIPTIKAYVGIQRKKGVAEDEILQYASEKTSAVNPYGGLKDRQFRGSISEAFDQPYPIQWEESDYGDIDALAKLDDGTYLSIMFNNSGLDSWNVEFHRNNSQEVTGEGDASRVFATVLTAIKQFIQENNPHIVYFSAVKDQDPKGSRAKLYDRLVQRYASQLGYSVKRITRDDEVGYNLVRLQKVKEASGYIPSEKEKNDPRFKTALTVDVRPNTMKKDAKKFGNKISRAGIPPTARPDGKF